MRRLSRLMAFAGVALIVAGCSGVVPGGQDDEPLELRIGVLAPVSDPNRPNGLEALRGAQLAAEMITDGTLPGEVGTYPSGMRVSVIAGNTKDNPEEGARQAARLVNDEGVAALVSAGAPEVTASTSQRAERLEVPLLSGDATADFLTERGLAWFFRTGPSARSVAESLYSVLLQGTDGGDPSLQTVAVLYQETPQARADAALLGELAAEGGFELGTNLEVGASAAGLDDAVAQTVASSPGAVFLVAETPAGARRLFTPFRRAADSPTVLGFGPGFADSTFSSGRDAAGLMYGTSWSHRVAERNPVAQTVARAYRERHKQPMTAEAAGTFTAVHSLAEAVARAGATTPAAVRAALLGLDVSGRSTIMPWDGIRFDATGQNTRAVGVVQQRLRNSTRIVFPTGLRDGDAVPPEKAR
jgi:branched-chain amino acid transport system substrate-binding protein